MNDDFVVAGQITTGHSDLADLTPEKVATAIKTINELLPVRTLCIGWREIPDLYHALTSKARVTEETYVWYPLLSDYPGLEPLIISVRRDEKLIEKLETELNRFCDDAEQIKKDIG